MKVINGKRVLVDNYKVIIQGTYWLASSGESLWWKCNNFIKFKQNRNYPWRGLIDECPIWKDL